MAKQTDNPVQTRVIDNFKGNMTPYRNGDLNNGRSYWIDVFGSDPFTKPGNLTWNEQPTLIDAAGSVITDLIMAGKPRLESGTVYVYAIGHTGRLYKIQVNDPTTYNPDYDNPVLLATLTSGTPTFTRGGFMDFFGSTERIYIGHDKGVTRIDFDGTNETVVGVVGSWTQTVPRPLQQFGASLYAGNGSNLAEIIGAGTVATYSKLSPSFPTGTQVRDIKLNVQGTYLQMVVTRATLPDITATTADTSLLVPTDSYIFKWNGIDTGYTSLTTYPSVILTASILFGDSEYVMGFDAYSGSVWNPVRKLMTALPNVVGDSPTSNAIASVGNLCIWVSNLNLFGVSMAMFLTYGSLSDYDIEPGFWSNNTATATTPETDVIRVPYMGLISNIVATPSGSGYANNLAGTPKLYYSTLETSSAPTTKYRFYKFPLYPTGLGTPIDGAIYQTQNQLFPKKIAVSEVRVYGKPWVTNNSFQVDLIGSDDTPISGSSMTFTAGSTLTVGNDFAWYTVKSKPIYSMALRITNLGTANFVIDKVEIDYTSAGR